MLLAINSICLLQKQDNSLFKTPLSMDGFPRSTIRHRPITLFKPCQIEIVSADICLLPAKL